MTQGWRDIVGGAPLLRPLAALIAGILLAVNIPLFLCLVTLCALAMLILFVRQRRLYASIARSVGVSLLFVALGVAEVMVQERGYPGPLPTDNAVYLCRIAEDAYFEGKTYRCRVDVLGRMDSVEVSDGARAMLYLADTVDYARLIRGDMVYVRTAMSLPNFSEGYRDYLLRNNICGTGYVAAGELVVAGHVDASGLMSLAEDCRNRVNEWYASLGFEGDELAILSALTIGLRDDISDELNEDYSISGLAHVLSLSGLHVGFIFFIIQLLLRPLARGRWGSLLAWMVLTIALAVFALFTGMSSPVIRACFMMSAFGFAMLTRRGTSLNALCIVAMAMLVWDYRYVYDVSFQMSFMAVLFILLFYPRLKALVSVRHRVLRYIVDIFILSAVAQAGVAPIIACTFGTFSVYGIVSSVVVVPFLSLLMYAAVAMILLSWVPLLAPLMADVVNQGLSLLNGSATFFSDLPLASAHVEFSVADALFCYALTVLVLWWIVTRVPAAFRWAMIVVMLWIVWYAVGQWRRSSVCEIVFSNNPGSTTCTLVDGFDVYAFDVSGTDSLCTFGDVGGQAGCAADFCGATIVRIDTVFHDIAGDGRIYRLDYLWLSRGAKGHLEQLVRIFDVGHLVLDASLTPYYRRRYLSEADTLGVEVIDMHDRIEWRVQLSE